MKNGSYHNTRVEQWRKESGSGFKADTITHENESISRNIKKELLSEPEKILQ